MAKYIEVLLLENGVFCKAPSCAVNEGDLVGMPDVLTGGQAIRKVIATAFVSSDSDTVKMIEKYIGYELPPITQKFTASEVDWNEVL